MIRSLVVGVALSAAALAAPSMAPVNLRCEFRTNPLGLGEMAPRLSWKLAQATPPARGLRQTAWQIRVVATPEALGAGRADLWDSGKISSDATNNLPYAGAPLKSRATCFWSVRVWDLACEVLAWSASAN